jgi:hypothetical protein
MPTLIQMTFRLILILAFTAFWSALTVANLVYKWWRKRGRYFVTIRHQRPAVLDSPGTEIKIL